MEKIYNTTNALTSRVAEANANPHLTETELSSRIQQKVREAQKFWYFVIMAISAISTDGKTRVMYHCIMDGISDPLSLIQTIDKLKSFYCFMMV